MEACRQWWSWILVAAVGTEILCAEAATNAPGPLAARAPVQGAALAWPQWRGPLATGVSPTAHPPLQWSETNHVRWKLPLPGKGHSSPIILGDCVVVMTALPVGEPQKPVFDQAPGVHDSVPVTHRHEYAVASVSRKDGRIVWKTIVREDWPHEGGHTTGSPESNGGAELARFPTTLGRLSEGRPDAPVLEERICRFDNTPKC